MKGGGTVNPRLIVLMAMAALTVFCLVAFGEFGGAAGGFGMSDGYD